MLIEINMEEKECIQLKKKICFIFKLKKKKDKL